MLFWYVKGLFQYLYTPPKGNIALDPLGRRPGRLVGPSRVLVRVTIDGDVVVARLTFPCAGSVCGTLLEVLPMNGFGRKDKEKRKRLIQKEAVCVCCFMQTV